MNNNVDYHLIINEYYVVSLQLEGIIYTPRIAEIKVVFPEEIFPKITILILKLF